MKTIFLAYLHVLVLTLIFSKPLLADNPECNGDLRNASPKIPLISDVEEIIDYSKDYCAEIDKVYERFLGRIKALPKLENAKIDWDNFFQNLQVLDVENQMSCVGHSLARAISLASINAGKQVTPSPEFLYDIGLAYMDLMEQGVVDKLMRSMKQKSEVEERAKKLGLIYQAYQDLKKSGKLEYSGTNIGLTLDYAATQPIPYRENYREHFQGMSNSKAKLLSLKFMGFPPVEQAIAGTILKCFSSNRTGKRLKDMSEYSPEGTHLAGFDFRLIDQSLAQGYFPVVSINTDAVQLKKSSNEISYDTNGSIGHAFVVVGRGKDGKGVYYETLDSWADENMKSRDKKFTMRKYKIYQSNLKKKITEINLITSLDKGAL